MKFKKKSNNDTKLKTRKLLRKEKRQEKKQKKNEYFSNRKQSKTQQHQKDKTVLVKNEKAAVTVDKKSKNVSKSSTGELITETLLEKQRNKEKQMQNNIQKGSKTVRNKHLLKANEDEDKEIKRLEKLLNLNKRKSKKIPSSFVSDGLDYLLELCDSQKRQEISEYEAQAHLSDSESDFEADLAEVTGKKKAKTRKKVETTNKKVECENSGDEFEGGLSESDLDENENDFDEDIESENGVSSDDEENESHPDDDDEFDSDVEGNLADEDDEELSNEIIENPFSDDDSVDEDDFDVDLDDSDAVDSNESNMDSDPERIEDGLAKKGNKRKVEATNTSNKRVKFADEGKDKAEGKLSQEERMKELMGYVQEESKERSKRNAIDKKVMESKDSKVLSKEERMKKLMGFVEKESGNKETIKEKPEKENVKKNLSKEERMKRLLGFVNEEKASGSEEEEGDGTWEDIYGRKRDRDGNVVQEKSDKYVPPHLRNSGSTNNKESLMLLKRQMKGLLNRLTENNIKSISTGIESLYTAHSRHDTNQALLTLLRDSLLTDTLTPGKMMSEHAMLITVLHANIGTEIGASLLQTLVQEWDTLYKTPQCHQVDNKQLDNYLALLADLYQFKLLTHTLVYDILDVLIDTFDEKSIELILTLLKTIGLSLRKDNAVRFKFCLLSIQAKARAQPDLSDKPRTKFMLDVLLCVKNNNVHKIPGYDVSTIQRMRASLKLLVRPSCYVSELNIGLQDLLRADEKGRWWIVGSAWSGKTDVPNSKPADVPKFASQFSTEILELARKQRMNTDVRRNVFCVLMSSEDYLDAYEKLLKLGIKQDQMDDVINVIVHCLLNEKRYNPYYTHLLSHFIASNRRYRMLVQYTVWDKFKLLHEMKPAQIVNLAKFLSALFVQHALPVSVLKVIEFTELTKHHVRLVRQIFLALLLTQDDDAVRSVFGNLTKSPELRLLREGLHLFLITFVMNKLPTDGVGERMRRNANVVGELLAPR